MLHAAPASRCASVHVHFVADWFIASLGVDIVNEKLQVAATIWPVVWRAALSVGNSGLAVNVWLLSPLKRACSSRSERVAQGRTESLIIRLSSAIYGRWPALSDGHSNVGFPSGKRTFVRQLHSPAVADGHGMRAMAR